MSTAIPAPHGPDPRRPEPRRAGQGRQARRALLALLGLIVAVFWLLPLVLVAMNALKDKREYLFGNTWQVPRGVHLLENVAHAWELGLGGGFMNSLLYGLAGAGGAILLASLAAYGIVRLKIRRSLFWFLLIYSGTVFPFQMYLIPLFKAYLTTNLYDTRLGMTAFYVAICIPFCTFVMRGFFLSLPWDFQEAARLDGASDWQIFWRVMFPMARAPMLVLLLFQFTWIWNDLLFGLILTKSAEVRPIMPTLVGMQSVYGSADGPTTIAAVLVASLPTLLLFLGLQRFFLQGLRLGTVGD